MPNSIKTTNVFSIHYKIGALKLAAPDFNILIISVLKIN